MVINNKNSRKRWSRASTAINTVQVKCQIKSIHLSFNKSSTFFSAICEKARQPPSVLCSSASVLVFRAPVAEDTVPIAPHLISSLSLRYLAQHHRAANGRWAAASTRRRRRARSHRKRSLNHALTTWSPLSPPLPPAPSPSISCCCIQIRPWINHWHVICTRRHVA